ncbi:hypothetical protein HGRIS_008993 [Hohenbuehelia grisea]|uniref:Female-specific protein transformer n=1 Tax=Hohenbuehelia grisea TaxID=104357 RepID=A0ABR3IZR8_9AGAR
MPRRHHPEVTPFNSLLVAGATLQTAPRRDVPFFSLPAISETSVSGSSSSSAEYAAGQMELNDEERARWKQSRARAHSSRYQNESGSRGRRSESRNDSFKRCDNMKDRGLHAKACATQGTSPVNVSRDSDYLHGPLAHSGRPPPDPRTDDSAFPPRGRTGRPSSVYHAHPHAHRSRSRSRTAADSSTFRVRARAHPESGYVSAVAPLAVTQPSAYMTSAAPYTAYDATPRAHFYQGSTVPRASSAAPGYPFPGSYHGPAPIPIAPYASHPSQPFAPLENDPYRSRYYRP